MQRGGTARVARMSVLGRALEKNSERSECGAGLGGLHKNLSEAQHMLRSSLFER